MLAMIFGGMLIAKLVIGARTVYPSAQNESDFLKSYTPNEVLARFQAAKFAELASGSSSGAEEGFATHEADFEPTIQIQAKDWLALAQAVKDDIAFRLNSQHAYIVEESGSATDGFSLKYAVGNTEGDITIEPVKSASPIRPDGACGDDCATVKFSIEIREKWFREKSRRELAQSPAF
jgi:hypothetical protein